jgi:hypothetical protein
MSLFEFTFGLSAVILGLALTHMASSVNRLVLAGRRVCWAPEPILLTILVGLVIVSVWLGSWAQRAQTATTMGLMLVQVVKLLFPYMAAAFVLPETPPEQGRVDLYTHYDQTRHFTFGVLIGGLLLFWVHREIVMGGEIDWIQATMDGPWLYVLVYGLLMVVRNRWANRILLIGALAVYAWTVIKIPLTE